MCRVDDPRARKTAGDLCVGDTVRVRMIEIRARRLGQWNGNGVLAGVHRRAEGGEEDVLLNCRPLESMEMDVRVDRGHLDVAVIDRVIQIASEVMHGRKLHRHRHARRQLIRSEARCGTHAVEIVDDSHGEGLACPNVDRRGDRRRDAVYAIPVAKAAAVAVDAQN